MLVTNKNLDMFVKKALSDNNIKVDGLVHNVSKHRKLVTIGNKPTWRIEYFKVEHATTGNLGLRLFIDATTGQVTVRDSNG